MTTTRHVPIRHRGVVTSALRTELPVWPRPSAGEGTAGREPDARLRNGETETHYRLRPGHVKRFPVVIGTVRATLALLGLPFLRVRSAATVV